MLDVPQQNPLKYGFSGIEDHLTYFDSLLIARYPAMHVVKTDFWVK